MTRVLVLGGTVMLGHMVLGQLAKSPRLDVMGSQRSDPSAPGFLDARRGAADLRALWDRGDGFEYVVNCLGVTHAVLRERGAEALRDAILVNALFPHELATFARERGARVIHVSTDGVFAGGPDAYAEDAPHDSKDPYGKTKSLGEVAASHVLALRCSIVGPDPSGRRGLLEWFLAQPPGKEVVGYTDHVWHGVTTLQLARLFERILAGGVFDALRREGPALHFCPNPPVTKFELLRLFGEVFDRCVVVRPGLAPGGPVRRVLATSSKELARLRDEATDLRSALGELLAVMRQGGRS